MLTFDTIEQIAESDSVGEGQEAQRGQEGR